MAYSTRQGFALVTIVLFLIILAMVGTGLVYIIRKEAVFTVRDKKEHSALYLAEAGVEYAINRLVNEGLDYRGPAEKSLGEGQYSVSVTTSGQPDDYYLIISTGYVKNRSDPETQRSLAVIVEIKQGIPDEAIRCKGDTVLESNVTMYGVIRSDGKIDIQSNVTLKPDVNGNCAVYTSTDVAASISIGTNFRIDPDAKISEEEMRCRGPKNDHDGDAADDPGSGIWKEANIVAGNPLLAEEDSSEKTESMGEDVSIIDEEALLAIVDETYETRQTYESSYDFYLDSKTWLFKKGVTFDSNVTFYGLGTLIVKTYGEDVSMYDYGMEFKSNVEGPAGEYATVNLIVMDGNWGIKDILMNSNVKIDGIIQGSSDAGIIAESNVDIKGIVISNGGLDLKSNVNLQWSEPAFEIPTREAGEIRIISWKEF